MPMQGGMMKGKTCGCPHHKVVPLLIVLFALAFLLEDFMVLPVNVVNIIWPVLVGLAGIMQLMEGSCKCC